MLGGVGGVFANFEIDDCLIVDNGGDGLHLEQTGGTEGIQIAGCSIVGNEGMGLWSEIELGDFSNNIVASNTGASVVLPAAPDSTMNCCDLYGNDGGDWTGSIAALADTLGNISLDPRFCGDDNPDDPYSLKYSSPCSAENSECGQIGARGVGFFDTPRISSITDVGNDQGKQARLIWRQTEYDNSGTNHTITGYGVYREQGAFKNSSPATSAGVKLLGWDYITTVPARRDSIYQYVAATLCDSTINAGLCMTTFMISAITSDPGTYFDSQPDSGYSVDNLSPGAPENVVLNYSSTENALTWDSSPESDFSHFLVYRSLVPDPYSTETAELLGTTVDPEWQDAIGPQEYAWGFRYWIVSVDFSGNCSLIPGESDLRTDVPGVPARTALHAAVPNPFNPRTRISFDLAKDAVVDLRVFDIAGRRVKTLVHAELRQQGQHEIYWGGRDDSGRNVSAGVYFYKLEAGAFTETRRVTLLKSASLF